MIRVGLTFTLNTLAKKGHRTHVHIVISYSAYCILVHEIFRKTYIDSKYLQVSLNIKFC